MIDELYEREYKPRYPSLSYDEIQDILNLHAIEGDPFPDILDKANRLKSYILTESQHLIPYHINGYPVAVHVDISETMHGSMSVFSVRFSTMLCSHSGKATAFAERHHVVISDIDDEFASQRIKTRVREVWKHMSCALIEAANERRRKENGEI